MSLTRFGVALVALAWLVPNHYLPWISAYNEASAFVGLLFLGAAAARARPARWMALLPGSVCVVLVVGLIPFAQLATGQLHFSGDAWVSFLYMASLAGAIAAGFCLSRRPGYSFAEELAWAVLGSALVSSFLAMLQGLQLTPLGLWMVDCPPSERPYANLAQPNNLATVIGFGLASLLLLHERRKLGRLASFLGLLVLSIGLGLTQSRTALLFGPLVLIGLFALRRRIAFETSIVSAAVATALQWGVSLAWPTIQSAILLTPIAATLGERGAGSIRFEMWPRLLAALWMQPWTGFGWLQVGQAQMASAEKFPPAQELWFHAHNLFLDLCLWVGAPLGILLSLAVAYWVVTRWRRVADIETACAMFALSFFFVHAMLELPHHYAYFLIPAGLWMGQVDSATGTAVSVRQPVVLLAAGWAVALLVFLGMASDYLRVEEDFRTMRFEVLGVGRPEVQPPRVETRFMSGIADYIDVMRQTQRPSMSANELDELALVTERFPYAAVMRRDAVALALNGREAEAEQMFIKIRFMHGEATYRDARNRLHTLRTEQYPMLEELDKRLP